MSDLQGKRAIVTGAGSGIGRASAILFAQLGASVMAVDLDTEAVNHTAATIRAADGKAIAVAADASDETAVRDLVERCVAEYRGLDVFYANAGISGGNLRLEQLTAADWMTVLKVNLVGPFLAIKYGSEAMKKSAKGAIICTASVAGLRSAAGASHYSASKAGVISLVQTSANQLAGSGIRVNAICPGLIETGMTRPMFEAARAAGRGQKIGQLNPLRRAGAPEEIADVAAFLASDEASYINGQAIAVDGGLSSTHPFVPGRLA